MEQVIFWTVILGTGVFGIGLISAISSRRGEKTPVTEVPVIEVRKTISPETGDSRTGEMNRGGVS